ncbi:TELO2-interacting protein 2-like isoform X1 [Tachypleus tridentatus]|uniref:TELO2-interacting protein 2-like isoform X1 n=1 Tax=Tachypleus tridentatus TaxID=6853 RepID=UPI003FD23DB8
MAQDVTIEILIQKLKSERYLLSKQPILRKINYVLKEEPTEFGYGQNNTFVIEVVSVIADSGMVQEFQHGEDREYQSNDFLGVADTAVESLDCLLSLLVTISHKLVTSTKLLQTLLTPVVMLCASHSEHFLWTNPQSVDKAEKLLEVVCTVCGCSHISEVLASNEAITYSSPQLAKPMLDILKEKLTQNNWRKNPAMKEVFKWLLFNIKHPCLSEHLSNVLPPSLLFVDDHTTEHKVLGIRCLNHIADNVPPTELKRYGRADVLYDALKHLIYNRELEIIEVLHPCVLSLLESQEPNPSASERLKKPGKYDEFYQKIVIDMEQEQMLALRKIYSRHILSYIDKLGITVIRHFKHTLQVLLEYIITDSDPDETARKNCLCALKKLIIVAWPRIDGHCEDILKTLLHFLCDVSIDLQNSPNKVKEDLLELTTECLHYLKRASSLKFKELTDDLLDLDPSFPGYLVIKEIIQPTLNTQ